MLRLFLQIFFMAAFLSYSISAQTPAIETGVSQTLAKWRAANYSDVRYKLNLTLERGAPLMRGEIEVRVKLTEAAAKEELILDWRMTQFQADKDKPTLDVIQVNESVIKELPPSGNYDYRIDKEHLFIAPRHLKAGENFIKIQFASPIKTSGAAITRYVDKEDGAEYVYSLFVPSDASTAFPVFDQPDLKARFQLNVVVPPEWKVVANTYIKTKFEAVDASGLRGKPPIIYGKLFNSFIFEETKPISTYVFAFAAGDFAEFTEYDRKTVLDEMDRDWKVKAEETRKARGLDEYPHKSPTTEEEISRKMGTRIYVRKSQAEKFKQHSNEVFRLNREAVKYLETYFNYKFPFPKYDLVLIPEFPFRGMEHAGATFLREESIIFPTEPTKNDFVSRANVIFHEAAHQWFGDLVTMRWFDDLWLKEGFAEFMAYKTLERVMPEYNAWKIFYERNKQLAYLTDSTKGTTPIYQEIPNLSAAKSAYGNIVYRKAPSFLKQAEFYLGADKFQTAVRQFLKKHEFKNAEWTDLVKEFETASGQVNLENWANVWVTKRGMPIISKQTLEGQEAMHGCCFYSFYQRNLLGDEIKWRQKLKLLRIVVDSQTQKETKRAIYGLEIVGPKTSIISTDEGLKAPFFGETSKNFASGINSVFFGLPPNNSNFVYLPNYQDYGYGIFLLDEKSRDYVLGNIQNERDDFLRTMMWGALWDSVREAELDPQTYVELVVKNLSVESDESTIQTLLGRVLTAMNYYLSDKQREEVIEKVENLLIEKMTSARTKGQRITFYRAFLNIASTKKAALALENILETNNQATPEELELARKQDNKDNKELEFAGLPILSTKDKFDVVTKLLILGDADAPRFLAELEKTQKSDEAKRYAYAARAAIATAENKRKFWTDFVGNKEISESWIESAFVSFNAPRHSELTLPYLEKSLAELPNLKRTRKIFFVNGWLAAFIGGQRSGQALNVVNKFLADNPGLDKDLRLKILENADNLERAVKIRRLFAGENLLN